MSDTDGAAPAAAPATGELSISEAVNYLNRPPKDREQEPLQRPQEEPRVAREKSTPPGVDAEPPEEAPGEEPEVEDEAEEPPVKPPRTWTKAEKEAFALLPREHQQSIVDRESERDSYYQRGLQEAAQRARTAQSAQQAAEQARVQYEAALPQLFQQFSAQFQTEFQDIKTWDDVSAMRQNDPMRFMAWQEAKAKGETLQKEAQQAQERQHQQYWQRFAEYTKAEDAKSEEYLKKEHPKLGAMDQVGKGVRQMLIDDVGFTDQEVSAWWTGQPMSLRDSRVQKVFVDAFAYRKAKAGVKEASETRKPVPPVQRPGTASNRGESQNVQAKILSDRLTKSGKLEDAVALLNARTARRR